MLTSSFWSKGPANQHGISGGHQWSANPTPIPNPLLPDPLQLESGGANFFLASLKSRSCYVTQLWPTGCKQKSARSLWDSSFFCHKGTVDASAFPSLLTAFNLAVIFGAVAVIL